MTETHVINQWPVEIQLASTGRLTIRDKDKKKKIEVTLSPDNRVRLAKALGFDANAKQAIVGPDMRVVSVRNPISKELFSKPFLAEIFDKFAKPEKVVDLYGYFKPIIHAFRWGDQPQGARYWEDIYDQHTKVTPAHVANFKTAMLGVIGTDKAFN